MRGRKPKHPSLVILQGNPGKRPIPEMPKMVVSDATPPDLLAGDEEALRYWHQTAPHLIELEILAQASRDLYAQGCKYWSRSQDLTLKFNARLTAFNAAYRIFNDFGATPVSLVRLAKRPMKESPGTKWGGTLG